MSILPTNGWLGAMRVLVCGGIGRSRTFPLGCGSLVSACLKIVGASGVGLPNQRIRNLFAAFTTSLVGLPVFSAVKSTDKSFLFLGSNISNKALLAHLL